MKPEDEKNVAGSLAIVNLGLFYYNSLFELKPVEVNCLRVLLASEYVISVSTSSDATELCKNCEGIWP